jgi:hypothetical protein
MALERREIAVQDIVSARRSISDRRDLAVLLLYGVVWLSMCAEAGVRPEALNSSRLVSEHVMLRFASIVEANHSELVSTIWLVTTIVSFPVLAWLLSRRPLIAVGSALVTGAGWMVFVGVNLWSMILADPEPGAADGYFSVPVYGIIYGGLHVALAWGLLAGCSFACGWWRGRTAGGR